MSYLNDFARFHAALDPQPEPVDRWAGWVAVAKIAAVCALALLLFVGPLSDAEIAGATESSEAEQDFVDHCHANEENKRWCEWMIFMEDEDNAAWFRHQQEQESRPYVPAQLQRIGWCESGTYRGLPRYELDYQALNQRGSTASGGYQILDGTWATWRHYVDGASQYARAVHAPAHVQDRVAVAAYERHGSSPWNASRGCWG